MDTVALILVVPGVAFVAAGIFMVRRVLQSFPLGRRLQLNGLLASKVATVEGFARGAATQIAPLTGKPCIAYEIRGLIERQTNDTTYWVPAGTPLSMGTAFELEDEEGDQSVHIAADGDMTFGGLGEAADEQSYTAGHQTELHEQLGIFPGESTMLRQWVIEPLDQCAVSGMATVREDGSWGIQGDPRSESPLLVVPGTVAAARSKILAQTWIGVVVFLLGVATVGLGVFLGFA